MKTINKILIWLGIIAGFLIITNIFLLIHYKQTEVLIPIPQMKI